MEKLKSSKLELTMLIVLTHYSNGVWTLDGQIAPEEGIFLLIYSAFPEYGEDAAKKAIEYIKTKWNGFITKERIRKMDDAFISYENAYPNESRVLTSIDKEDASFYCLLGQLYDNKGEVQIANYWFQCAAMLGDAEGEGRVGIAYHRGYGVIPEDMNVVNNVLEVMRWMNDDNALLWLKRAESHGWQEASRYIGEIQNEIDERDNVSIDDLIKRAETGTYVDYYMVASLYEYGDEKKNIPVDYRKAVNWYERAAENDKEHASVSWFMAADLLEMQLNDKNAALRDYKKAYQTANDDRRPELKEKIIQLESEISHENKKEFTDH